MSSTKRFFLFSIAVTFLMSPAYSYAANSYFSSNTNIQALLKKYKDYSQTARPISILVVPGHDNDYSGARYSGLIESKLNLDLAQRIASNISTIPGIIATTSRISNGEYTPSLSRFITLRGESVMKTVAEKRKVTSLLKEAGVVQDKVDVPHAVASDEVSKRLNSTNEWANQNGFDIVLHVHFNDYGSRRYGEKKYSGIAVYYPDKQYGNGEVSSYIAGPIYRKLTEVYPKSNFPKEDLGLIEDQSLIALGAHNTLRPVSVLVEYGYIYERQFTDPFVRNAVFDTLSSLTCEGVAETFEVPQKSAKGYCGSSVMPLGELGRESSSADVVKLQSVLARLGFLPPKGYDNHVCKVTGFFGDCTEKAVKNFQKTYKLPVTGYVGAMTREKLGEVSR